MPNTSAACIICLSSIKSPVSLPCGHVFCQTCLEQVISSIHPFTVQHCCPTCRAAYCIVTPDPEVASNSLSLHFFAPIRNLFPELLKEPQASGSLASSSITTAASTSRDDAVHARPPKLLAELHRASSPAPEAVQTRTEQPSMLSSTSKQLSAAEAPELRAPCGSWRQRAELHAATTLGLVGLARMTRDHALAMRQERDRLAQKCAELEAMLAVLGAGASSPAGQEGPQEKLSHRQNSAAPGEGRCPSPTPCIQKAEETEVTEAWTSPPAGRAIHLLPLPQTPLRSRSPLSPPRPPSPIRSFLPDESRSAPCSGLERTCDQHQTCEGSDGEPSRKRWWTEEPEVLLAQTGQRALRGAHVVDSRARLRLRARRAVSQYLGEDADMKEA